LASILPLLDHAHVTVRNAAALYGLAIAPDSAPPVLETISAGRDKTEAVCAWWALERWREAQTRPRPPRALSQMGFRRLRDPRSAIPPASARRKNSS